MNQPRNETENHQRREGAQDARATNRTPRLRSPIIVFEEGDGVCAFRTVGNAMKHGGLDGQFFDAGGRQLRSVDGSSKRLMVASEEDRSSYVREEVQRRLERVMRDTERNQDTAQALDEIRSFLDEVDGAPGLSFSKFASKLALLLRPKAVDPVYSPGGWTHYLCAAHHR